MALQFSLGVAALVPHAARAEARYWVGPVNGLWSDPNNWSATPGGVGGAGVPQEGDGAGAPSGIVARFDYAYGQPGIGVADWATASVTQDLPSSAMVAVTDMVLPKFELSGGNREGRYTQTAGTAILNSYLILGQSAPDSSNVRGFYTLGGDATLSVARDLFAARGTFTQSGGVCTIMKSAIMAGPKPAGIAMSGGTLNIASAITVNAGASTFSGGHTTVGSRISVTGGTVTVTAGSLSTGSIIVNFAGHFLVSGGAVTASQSTIVNAGSFTYAGGSLSVGTLVIDDGHFFLAPGGDKVLPTRGIAFTGTSPNGKLHLADNAITVDYAPGDSQLTSVRTSIVNGYNNGSWNGVGIISNLANTTTRGVGYAEASALGSIPAIFGDVDDTTVLVRLTRYGDADLIGFVNLSDFNRLASNFGQSFGAVWSQGDFNYDGRVNLNDFNLLASNFGLSATGPTVTPQDWSALASVVPEPVACGLFGVAASAARCGRSRRPRASTPSAKSCRKETCRCA